MVNSSERFEESVLLQSTDLSSHTSCDLQGSTSVSLTQSNHFSVSAHSTISTHQPSTAPAPAPAPTSFSSPPRPEQSLLKPFLGLVNKEDDFTHLAIHNDETREILEPLPPSVQYVQIDTSPHLAISVEFFQLLPVLRVISIGEHCLQTTPGLVLHQLPSLRSVHIGSNSFKSTVSGKNSVLSIQDCPCLLSLTVGEGALNGCAMVVLQQLANLKEMELCARCFPLCELFVLQECCTVEQLVFPEQSFSSINEVQIARTEMKAKMIMIMIMILN